MPKRMIIKHLIDYLEQLAPIDLAASFDNSGLLIGLMGDEIQKVLLSLDVTPKVVDHAIATGADIIVSHHPYFITPLQKINDPLLIDMIRNKIALLSMHTNLDFVAKGVNTELAEIIGLNDTEFLSPHPEITTYHIAVYVQGNAVEKLSKAVFEAGAGKIGNYSHCLNKYPVEGQFKPLGGSKPVIGSRGYIEEIEETKLEFFTDSVHLNKVLNAMIEAHPYETPTYSLYPLQQTNPNYGLGLVGSLPNPLPLKELALNVKNKLQAPFVKLWPAGNPTDILVQKIAVCGGSGSDLIKIAEQKAEVFITGDLKYHGIINSTIPLIDAGHFYTENPIMKRLQEYLQPLHIETEVFDKAAADINNLICL